MQTLSKNEIKEIDKGTIITKNVEKLNIKKIVNSSVTNCSLKATHLNKLITIK